MWSPGVDLELGKEEGGPLRMRARARARAGGTWPQARALFQWWGEQEQATLHQGSHVLTLRWGQEQHLPSRAVLRAGWGGRSPAPARGLGRGEGFGTQKLPTENQTASTSTYHFREPSIPGVVDASERSRLCDLRQLLAT